MTQLSPADTARFNAACEAYQAGRAEEARGLVGPVLRSAPRFADGHHLTGLCLINLGEFEAAEKALRTAVALDRRNLEVQVTLAHLLRRPTRFAESEKLYRGVLAADRRHLGAATGLGRLFIGLGHYEDVLQLTAPLFAAGDVPAEVLELQADALKHLGRMEEALELNRRAVALGGAGALLEITGIQRELGRYQEAEATARETFAVVGEAPAAFIVHGRALQELSRNDEAEAAYRAALARSPADDVAHEHLADLLFRRTGDAGEATALLDAALRQRETTGLVIVKSRMLDRIGEREAAYEVLAQAARRMPGAPALEAAASRAALKCGGSDDAMVDAALAHAERAYALAYDMPKIAALFAETCLAADQPERAAPIVEKLVRRSDNPAVVALQAMAWRMLGDPRYHQLYDYDRVLGDWIIETPKGWPSLEAFLADLAGILTTVHDVPLDAFGKTRMNGADTKQNIAPSDGAAVAALYEALDGPVREYLARIGKGKDPLRRRNQGGYRTMAAWSVKCESGAFHGTHLHPEGWLSSAFYVELPDAVEEEPQGWIKFGEPGPNTRPKLKAERFIKPELGRFLLFPSYMWHGTEPFYGEGTRLIMSIDFAPAPA